MTIGLLLISGMAVALVGSIKLPLARRLQIDEARVGGLVSAFGFTIIPMILISGFLTDHFGVQMVIVGGSFLLGVGLFTLARARIYVTAFIAILLLGSAWSAIVNTVNVIVPTAFGGSMTYATNLSNFVFGMGAFLTPIALSVLLRKRDIPLILSGLGLASLIPGILALAVDFSARLPATAVLTTQASPESVVIGLLTDPVLWLCALGFFFYSPLEAAMGAWSTTFLVGRGVAEATALRWLSVFWLCYMITRLITAFTLPAGKETLLILVLSVLCMDVMATVAFTRSARTAKITVAAAGLIFGPIFPTILALLLVHFPIEVRGRAIGLFFAIAAVGWTGIPALIGAYAKRTTIQRGFLIAVASAVALTLVAVALFVHFGASTSQNNKPPNARPFHPSISGCSFDRESDTGKAYQCEAPEAGCNDTGGMAPNSCRPQERVWRQSDDKNNEHKDGRGQFRFPESALA
jgi:fucose permease